MKQSYKQIPKKQRTLACRCSLIENFSHTEFVAELWCAKRACGAPWVRKCGKVPISEKLVTTWPYTDRPTDRPPAGPSVRTTGVPMFTLTLSSYFESPGNPRENWLHINVVINWQLSKQGTRCSVSTGRIAGWGIDPSWSSFFFFWSYSLTSY